MTTSRIQNARRGAFKHQKGKCYYCKRDMWELTLESKFDAAIRLLGQPTSKAGVKKKLAKLKCTAEHLVKQADKGSHQNENIVAACMDCNTRRGDLSVEDYLIQVQERLNGEKTGNVEELPLLLASSGQGT